MKYRKNEYVTLKNSMEYIENRNLIVLKNGKVFDPDNITAYDFVDLIDVLVAMNPNLCIMINPNSGVVNEYFVKKGATLKYPRCIKIEKAHGYYLVTSKLHTPMGRSFNLYLVVVDDLPPKTSFMKKIFGIKKEK